MVAGFIIWLVLFFLVKLFDVFIPPEKDWIVMFIIIFSGLIPWIPLFFFYKQINSLSSRFWLEMDQNTVKVTDNKGNVDQMIQIDPGDVISANEKYDLEDPPWKFVTKKYRKNKITIMNSKVQATFYFKPDSFYSINQLETILKLWQEKGCRIERIKA
jgi:hypothetical protein